MKLSRLLRVAALLLLPAALLSAQTLDAVFKSQALLQTSSAAPAALPYGWIVSAQSPTAGKLTPPGLAPVTFVYDASKQQAKLLAGFTSKAAMDAAFPNGSYAFSGPPAATASLTGDLYSAATPQVTGGGTWTNGVLVVDPSVTTTLTFSPFSDFGTLGGGQVGGHMDLSLSTNSGTDNVDLDQQLITQPLFGLPASTTPFTTFTMPAGTLKAGNVYQAELDYDRLSSLDTTTLSGGAVLGIYQKAVNFYVVAKSGTAALNPPVPSIPATVTAGLGGSVTIPVTGSGLGQQGGTTAFPIANWYFNGQPVDFSQNGKYNIANGQSLTIGNVSAADAGVYYAVVVGSGGLAVTGLTTLTTAQASLPVIVSQPQSVSIAGGGTAVFYVGATGLGLTYQWKLGGAPVTNSPATGSRLVVFGASAATTGSYTCTITNAAGSVTTNPATLAIATNFPAPGRLINLSVGTVVPASGALTLGFFVGGSNTSNQETVLVRADGPALAGFGIGNAMADPNLNLVVTNTAAKVASNDNWGSNAAAVSAAAVATSAFPITNTASLDAALVVGLSPNGYSAQITNNVAAGGQAIGEVYDDTATYSLSTPHLTNLSTLFNVPAGGSLTAGFVVGGPTAKTVLIRAMGPSLSPLGVGGVMADPKLTLNATNGANQGVVAANSGWGGDQAIQTVVNQVSAFSFAGNGSLDSALVYTLQPGVTYTATATSTSGGGGNVIVEVYEAQ